MFSNFSDRVLKTFDGLLSRGVLTENDVNSAMREIRVALLEADVPLNIAKDFVEKVKKKAVGEKLLKSVKPGDLVVKIVHDTLVELLSFNLKDEDFDLLLNKSPSIILMVGLQGSGKTTTAAKLANLLKLKKKKVLLSSLDISRPAAIEQLNQLSQGISVDYMDNDPNKKVSELIAKTMEQAKTLSPDFIIFFAPNDFKYSSFGCVVAAVTLQPSLLKIITAILPTPPDAPVTITSFTFSPSSKTSLVCFVVKAH